MNTWLTQLLGEQGATWTLYGLGAIGLLLLLWVAWFWIRRVAGGVFVEGGRGRKHRLAVVDATAVDSNRRIILVRRDDVEHLVMIGGENDLVIERNIATVPVEPGRRRDRRSREPAEPQPARRAVREEPPAGPARPPVREEPLNTAPVEPARPAREETMPVPPAAVPGAAVAAAAAPVALRRDPEPSPTVAEPRPAVEQAREPEPETSIPTPHEPERASPPPRPEHFAERDEPLIRAPEAPPVEEPVTASAPEEAESKTEMTDTPAPAPAEEDMRPVFAAEQPTTPEPESLPEPKHEVAANEDEPSAKTEEASPGEEAFTALFARGQGNGSTFAERFMFHASKSDDEPVIHPVKQVTDAENRSAEAPAPVPVTADIETPDHAGENEPILTARTEPEMNVEVEAPRPEDAPGAGQMHSEPTANVMPGEPSHGEEKDPGSLEDEMQRLLAQLTTGKR